MSSQLQKSALPKTMSDTVLVYIKKEKKKKKCTAQPGQSQVNLHSHAPYNRKIPLPSYQQVSASGTGQDSESKQLFRTGISSEISQNSGSREQAWSQNSFHGLYGPTATGGLKRDKARKKENNLFKETANSCSLGNHKMSVFLLYTAARALTFPKPWPS